MSDRQNVRQLRSRPPATGGNGTGGSDDRLREVEKQLAVIQNEISHLATKEDIEQKFSSQLRWFIGILITVVFSFGAILLRVFDTQFT